MIDDDDRLRAAVADAATFDPDAWEWLFRRSYGGLFAFARNRLGDDHRADDAVSETMARALRSIERFEWRGGGFDGWLFGILRNVVREAHRAGARSVATATIELEPSVSAEDVVADRAERDDVLVAYQRLSAADQEIIDLRDVAELSYADVAAAIGKRPGAVRMAHSRAVRRLARHMEEVHGV